MKCFGLLILYCCVFNSTALCVGTQATLRPADYDLAELVFRQFMSRSGNIVIYLSFSTNRTMVPAQFIESGTNDPSPPADFMGRFTTKTPLVRAGIEGIAVVDNRTLLDRATRKKAVVLNITEIRVTEDEAEVQVISYLSFTSNSQRFRLIRERGKWKIHERKHEWVADF